MMRVGFNELLRSQTAGKAFPNCVFSHWQVLSGDIRETNSKIADCIKGIRIRKGLKEPIPPLDEYHEKL